MLLSLFFFFNDTATTEIYTLSLHDALPICTHAFPHRQPSDTAARYHSLWHGGGVVLQCSLLLAGPGGCHSAQCRDAIDRRSRRHLCDSTAQVASVKNRI